MYLSKLRFHSISSLLIKSHPQHQHPDKPHGWCILPSSMKYLELLENFRCVQFPDLLHYFFCCLVYSSEEKVILYKLSRLFIGQYCTFSYFLIATLDILTNIIYILAASFLLVRLLHSTNSLYSTTSQPLKQILFNYSTT